VDREESSLGWVAVGLLGLQIQIAAGEPLASGRHAQHSVGANRNFRRVMGLFFRDSGLPAASQGGKRLGAASGRPGQSFECDAQSASHAGGPLPLGQTSNSLPGTPPTNSMWVASRRWRWCNSTSRQPTVVPPP